jgi:cytochrome c-type biogenesis protein
MPQSTEPITTKNTTKKWPISKKWLVYFGLGVLALIMVLSVGSIISHPIEQLVSTVEGNYQKWFKLQDTSNPLVLMSLAFLGGLLASISPCILGMLPVNLSYIGTLKIKSRWDAFTQASLFVLGAVTVLSLVGFFASFIGAFTILYKGHINLVVGMIMALMGLWLIGIIKIPLPTTNMPLPKSAGSYGVGFTFALVSSPCASPVLFAVLAAAAASGSQALGIMTMVSYALGYTMLIFLASLFTGLAKQSRKLLQHSEAVIRFGSVALIITGFYYLYAGLDWFGVFQSFQPA